MPVWGRPLWLLLLFFGHLRPLLLLFIFFRNLPWHPCPNTACSCHFPQHVERQKFQGEISKNNGTDPCPRALGNLDAPYDLEIVTIAASPIIIVASADTQTLFLSSCQTLLELLLCPIRRCFFHFLLMTFLQHVDRQKIQGEISK